jgi:hypothetical protein
VSQAVEHLPSKYRNKTQYRKKKKNLGNHVR